jgi:hypothetical protein
MQKMRIKGHWCLVLVMACAMALSPVAMAGAADTPDGFVRHLYAGYAPGKKPVAFDYPDAAQIVDKPLLKLLRRDDETSKGEVGALDYDPVCQCQDWGPFTLLSVKIVSSTAASAVVDATFRNFEGRNADHQTVRFDLVRTGDGWRIHDIHSRDAPSLVALFQAGK